MKYTVFREHYAFWGLLISLLLSFIFIPFLDNTQPLNLFLLSSMFFAVLAVGDSRAHFLGGFILAVPMLLTIGLSTQHSDSLLTQLSFSCVAVFFLYVIALTLQKIFRTSKVETHLLVAAICVYLIFAVVWTMFYALIGIYYPESFDIPHNTNVNDLMYFSLVTLTTLGYGDITPLSAPAKSVAVMEALVGQIYLTVLVARLVGMHIANKS